MSYCQTCAAVVLVSSAAARVGLANHEAIAAAKVVEPAEVAPAIAWLLDPAQNWVTEQVVSIDGGLSTVRPRPGARAQEQPPDRRGRCDAIY